jgi:hypothetical protein
VRVAESLRSARFIPELRSTKSMSSRVAPIRGVPLTGAINGRQQ